MSKGDDKNIGTSLDEISRILQEGDLSEVEKLKLIRQTLPPRVFPDETEPGLSGETLVARSFADLNDLLFLDSWEDSSKKYRPLKLFRGSSDASMGLRTSLQRLIKHTDSKSALGKMETRRIEEGMIDSFKKYAYGIARISQDASLWEWLALAQHHGLPTRLLDWTKSPYVALHFATNKAENCDKDAVVWVIDPFRFSMEYPCFREFNDWTAAKHNRRCWGVFSMNQLDLFHSWRTGKTGFHTPGDADALDMPFIFIEPPSLSRRVVNQWGCFLVGRTGERAEEVLYRMTPSFQDKINAASPPSEANHTHVFRKIIIPAKLKREVRDKLDAIGFTERTLFPGLDGLCDYLRRYYSTDRTHAANKKKRAATEEREQQQQQQQQQDEEERDAADELLRAAHAAERAQAMELPDPPTDSREEAGSPLLDGPLLFASSEESSSEWSEEEERAKTFGDASQQLLPDARDRKFTEGT